VLKYAGYVLGADPADASWGGPSLKLAHGRTPSGRAFRVVLSAGSGVPESTSPPRPAISTDRMPECSYDGRAMGGRRQHGVASALVAPTPPRRSGILRTARAAESAKVMSPDQRSRSFLVRCRKSSIRRYSSSRRGHRHRQVHRWAEYSSENWIQRSTSLAPAQAPSTTIVDRALANNAMLTPDQSHSCGCDPPEFVHILAVDTPRGAISIITPGTSLMYHIAFGLCQHFLTRYPPYLAAIPSVISMRLLSRS